MATNSLSNTADSGKTRDAALEFENGQLVKVNGNRPEYMGGIKLLDLVRRLATQLQDARDGQRIALETAEGWLEELVSVNGDDMGDTRQHSLDALRAQIKALRSTPARGEDAAAARVLLEAFDDGSLPEKIERDFRNGLTRSALAAIACERGDAT